MAAEVLDNLRNEFLESHRSTMAQLETHAALLHKALRDFIPAQSSTLELLQTRLARTKEVIVILEQSAQSLTSAWQGPSSNLPKRPLPLRAEDGRPESASRASQSAAAPSVDPSGLFSVDTNPTPVADLYHPTKHVNGSSRKQTKRKIEESDITEVASDELSGNEHSRKKYRDKDHIHVPEVDESFEKGVEARLRAKEERKAAKENKKRKRHSDSSSVPSAKPNQNKKQKHTHNGAVAIRPNDASSTKPGDRSHLGKRNSGGRATNSTAQNNQPSKRRKKSR